MIKCTATLTLIFPEKKAAVGAAKALEGALKKRTDSDVSVKGDSLRIEIKADDIVALRASINAYLRQLQAIEAVEEKVIFKENEEGG
jgi:tRNA threonylcarbamoyladenosine modification (KEOPS) complex  Pcc1 subunit